MSIKQLACNKYILSLYLTLPQENHLITINSTIRKMNSRDNKLDRARIHIHSY